MLTVAISDEYCMKNKADGIKDYDALYQAAKQATFSWQ